MFRVEKFCGCMPLAVGALIIGYLSYAIFNILGVFLIYSGVYNIIDKSTAFGVTILSVGVIVSIGYTAASYLLINGTRERDTKKIQWYSILILIAMAVCVFIFMFASIVKDRNQMTVIIISGISSVIFAYAFIIVFSLQQRLKEEEES